MELIGGAQERAAIQQVVTKISFVISSPHHMSLKKFSSLFLSHVLVSYCSVPQPFSPVAHHKLSKTHDGTPQNFASRKGGTKLYLAINMYLHINPCPIRMQAYEKHNTC
jgi:hypothetical protein